MLHKPTTSQLRSLASQNHFKLTAEELKVFQPIIESTLESYSRLDELAGSKKQQQSKIRRDKGRKPSREENPLGAWAWICSIKQEEEKNPKKSGQLLAGKRIAIKDNVQVAGVPLRNGSPLFVGFVSSIDATVVKRILEEGGEIVGKSTCENLCVSGGSHTSYPQPVRNPRNPEYMAGGSSSGSAALLAAGQVDMAIGGDQGGSIRIPSSWCGVYGIKPTIGLVPYTGIIGMDPVLDHVGPMANTVYDLATLLEAIAGRDGSDMRQINVPEKLPSYTEALRNESPIDGMKIGLVTEGFGWEGISEKDVDAIVRESAFSTFRDKLGAEVSEISIPEHRDAIHIWTCLVMEGTWYHSFRANGLEHHWAGEYDLNLLEHWARAVKRSGDKLPEMGKIISLVGSYAAAEQSGKYYGLAMNLRRELIRAYDSALQEYDLLLMPTTPNKAIPFGRGKMNLEQSTAASMGNLHNTCAFDASGHPALSAPCSQGENGLPVGLMLAGRYFDEVTILRAASAFEKATKKKEF